MHFERAEDVVGGAFRLQAMEEPHALLRVAHQRGFAAGAGDDLGFGIRRRAGLDQRGDVGEGRRAEELGVVEGDAGRTGEQGGKAGGLDRAEAEGDQVVFRAGTGAATGGVDGIEHPGQQAFLAGVGGWRSGGFVEKQGERAGGESLAGSVAADLAAGGAGQQAGADQHDAVDGDFQREDEGLAESGAEGGAAVGAQAGGFDREHGGLARRRFAGKGGGGGDFRRGGEGGFLDVFRRVIDAVQDDQVLDAADHVELAVFQIAAVTGAEFALEGGGAFGRAVPVAGGDGGAGQADLADLPVGAGPAAGGIGNAQSDVLDGRAAGDVIAGRGMAGDQRRAGTAGDADGQGGFGEAVAGEEGAGIEAAGGEAFGEALQGVRADALGTAGRGFPAGEIEPGEVLVADRAQAEFVGKIRAAAEFGSVTGNRAQPADGALDELVGREAGEGDPGFQ